MSAFCKILLILSDVDSGSSTCPRLCVADSLGDRLGVDVCVRACMCVRVCVCVEQYVCVCVGQFVSHKYYIALAQFKIRKDDVNNFGHGIFQIAIQHFILISL